MKNRLDEHQNMGDDMGMGTPASGPGGISLRNLRTFRSFKNPAYRFYFGGMLGQMFGMNMQMMTRSLLIYRLTGSAAILGAMSLAHAIPMLSLSLFGGVIADRVQKKYVLIAGQAGSAILSLGVGLTLSLGYMSAERPGSWWILAVSSVLQGTIMALMMPSRQSIIPEIVGEEQLMNAISLNTMGMNTLRLFAPALSGFLIEAVGFEAVYYTTAGTYLMAVFFISFLPLTGKTTVHSSSAWSGIKEGLNYIRHETIILFILGFTLITHLVALPFMQLMPVFTEDVLNVGASGLGVLMSTSGAGSILTSLILASLSNKKRGFMMLVSSFILGTALIGFSFSTSWNLSLSLIFFIGLGLMANMALSNTLIQYYADPNYRGRVISIMMMQFGVMSLSTFLVGVLAEGVGIQWAIGGFAIALVAISLLALVFVPQIRKLD